MGSMKQLKLILLRYKLILPEIFMIIVDSSVDYVDISSVTIGERLISAIGTILTADNFQIIQVCVLRDRNF